MSTYEDLNKFERKIKLPDPRITNILHGKSIRQLTHTKFILIKFSNYYAPGREDSDSESDDEEFVGKMHYIPGEVGLSVFSLADGIVDIYGTLIDPVIIPCGMKTNIKTRADKLWIPEPGYEDLQCKDITRIGKQMETFLRRHANEQGIKPAVFCREKKIKETLGCLDWFKDKGLEDLNFDIDVLPLEYLLHQMAIICRENMELQLKLTLNDALFTGTKHVEFATQYHRRFKLHEIIDELITDKKEKDKRKEKEAKKAEVKVESKKEGEAKAEGEATPSTSQSSSSTKVKPKPEFLIGPPKPYISEQKWYDQSILISIHHCEAFYNKTKTEDCTPGLPCLHHSVNRFTGVSTCPLFIVQSLAYSTIAVLSKHTPLTLEEGSHYPMKNRHAADRKTRLILGTWGIKGFDLDLTGKFINSFVRKNEINTEEDWQDWQVEYEKIQERILRFTYSANEESDSDDPKDEESDSDEEQDTQQKFHGALGSLGLGAQAAGGSATAKRF